MKRAFVIAAVSSGSGKTTICNGLLRAFADSGLRCAPFKVGPDYIDPIFHKTASGERSVNLDLFMSSKEHVKRLFNENFRNQDVAVVEGVMGLFDGYDCRKGSAAEIAELLGLPVILIVNAASSAYSLGAVIKGIVTFDSSIDVKGVIYNNVASNRHLSLLKRAAEDAGVEYIGHIRRLPDLETPSRYLGLALDDRRGIESYVAHAAEAVRDGIDIERLLELTLFNTESASDFDRYEIPHNVLRGKRIAVACDEAFNFVYPENLKALKKLSGENGELIEFSPLQDTELPDVDFVYYPGGYPELHAERLSENESMRQSVRNFVNRGGLVFGECGGLLYLSQSIGRYDMCGIFPFEVKMDKPKLNLGYRTVKLEDLIVKGHEFHYSRLVNPDAAPSIASQSNVMGERVDTRLYREKNCVAGYTHLYWGEPDVANNLFRTIFSVNN